MNRVESSRSEGSIGQGKGQGEGEEEKKPNAKRRKRNWNKDVSNEQLIHTMTPNRIQTHRGIIFLRENHLYGQLLPSDLCSSRFATLAQSGTYQIHNPVNSKNRVVNAKHWHLRYIRRINEGRSAPLHSTLLHCHLSRN